MYGLKWKKKKKQREGGKHMFMYEGTCVCVHVLCMHAQEFGYVVIWSDNQEYARHVEFGYVVIWSDNQTYARHVCHTIQFDQEMTYCRPSFQHENQLALEYLDKNTPPHMNSFVSQIHFISGIHLNILGNRNFLGSNWFSSTKNNQRTRLCDAEIL